MRQLTWDQMKALEGKRVRVILQKEPEEVIHEGILISICLDGEVGILNDDGTTGYSWPVLNMELIEED